MIFRKCVSNRSEKKKVKMNKPVYLGLSILEISKILMYGFWYDYIKPKYLQNAKPCYIDTEQLYYSDDDYEDIEDDA